MSNKYNWATIQHFYDEGHTFRDITAKFGAANETINRAVRSGLLVPRAKTAPKTKQRERKDATYRDVKTWRHKTRVNLVACFGSRCGICGVQDHPTIYDFHHLDPDDKDFTIAAKIRSWSKLSAEAKKCVLLCAPCHRKHHAGVLEIPSDIQRFDEALIGGARGKI